MGSRKRKALLISYAWPPMEGIGLLRVLKFAQYLPLYGWEASILTVKTAADSSSCDEGFVQAGTKVFRSEYRDRAEDIRRIFRITKKSGLAHSGSSNRDPEKKRRKNTVPSFMRELITMPDGQIGWYPFAVQLGMEVLQKNRFDIVFSTSPPETAHLIARKMKKEYGIPWVADLRDLWADDHFRPRTIFKKVMLKFIERNTLRDADAVVTVSEPWARTLRTSLGKSCPDVKVITNAFDDNDFASMRYGRNKKFTISYTGKLHREYQRVDPFFKALRDLIAEGRIDRNKIFVDFFIMGYDKPDITAIAKMYGLSDVVRESAKVSYSESLKIQKASDALLLIQWIGKGGEGCHTAKLYDYLGARRPVIALTTRGGVMKDLVRATSCGAAVYGDHDLRESILGLYTEYVAKGYVDYTGNELEIQKHTRAIKAGELAGLFDSLVADTGKLE
ncbi:MAG: glycosyltransferase [Candidatus Omnitrophota bacterium]|nr:glycosyltransferase [Candidatus Omnitrophota bacterium]